MAVTCKNCGGAHAIWECKRPATKSTATKVVRNRSGTAGSTPAPSTTKGGMGKSEARPSAGKQSNPLQALPVDTNSPPGLATGFSTTSAGTVGEKDRQPKFDKKAWSRAYMKIWMRNKRAKLKAESPAHN